MGCSGAIAAMAGAKFGTLAFADGNEPSQDQILVFVFFRGGMDGLNFIAPVDDNNYLEARSPLTSITETGTYGGIQLANAYSGFDFRLNHNGQALKDLYDSKDLAFIHASGLTNGTRSHFEAQDLMDLGIADLDLLTYRTGWLERLIQASHGESGTLPVVSMSGNVQKSLRGERDAVSIPNPYGFAFVGNKDQQKAVESLYQGDGILSKAGADTFSAVKSVQDRLPHARAINRPVPYAPQDGVKYPNYGLSRTFESLAQLIKMDVGLKFATIDYGGWDTHVQQNPHFSQLVLELSTSLSAFWNDMSAYHNRLTLVTVSEFGRRVRANQSNGTDHGHGNCMIALGKNVKGGKMYGKWPGLAIEQLDHGADLAVTTDYRWVLAEMCEKNYGIKDAKNLFPKLDAVQPVGVFG